MKCSLNAQSQKLSIYRPVFLLLTHFFFLRFGIFLSWVFFIRQNYSLQLVVCT